MKKTLICRFNDSQQILINSCTLPNPDITVYYNSVLDVFPDLQIIRDADKYRIIICDLDDNHIYEFYNMILSSTQILENGDGTITVHYYFKELS